jgi:hypothetical protein
MAIDPPPRSPVVRQHEERRHATGLPTTFVRNRQGDTRLAVERPERRLKIRDDRLDFDDEQRSGWLVEREDVDRASLAVAVERDLWQGLPPEITQEFQDAIRQVGMRRIQEPIQALTMPEHPHAHRRPEGRSNSGQDATRDLVSVPGFDAGDRRSSEIGLLREPLLGPTPPSAQGTDRQSDAHDIHRCRSVARRAYLGLICGGAAVAARRIRSSGSAARNAVEPQPRPGRSPRRRSTSPGLPCRLVATSSGATRRTARGGRPGARTSRRVGA